MIKSKIFIPLLLGGFSFLISWFTPNTNGSRPMSPAEDGVASILLELGSDKVLALPNFNIPGVSARAGEDLVRHGIVNKENGKSKKRRQSKHFVCTSCHNLEKEDPDLAIVDPQGRLEYTHKKGLPFLQGSPLYGAVNRETFYNDDYEKRYGDLVKPARHDIRGAIQLCAIECAQGRKLKQWEIESVLAFMWELELKMSDLNLNDAEKTLIETALENGSQREDAINLIKSKYKQRSPAHFIDPPENRQVGTYSISSAENGKLLYENSCLHCHKNQRYSYLNLDNSKLTFKYLRDHAEDYNRHSIYQVVRYGIESKSGKKSYMPKYPIEKMDVQQLDDLRLYIEKMAE